VTQPTRPRAARRALLLLLAGALAGAGARAQTIDNSERLDGDRPEAWGMKFAAAVTAFAPVGAMRPLDPGTIEIGLEAGSIPSLSEDERRIGFGGTKVEEIDRGPLFGRLRARFALPRGFDLALGLVPPVAVDGLEPLLFSAALAHPLHEGNRLRLGAWPTSPAARARSPPATTRSRIRSAARSPPTTGSTSTSGPSGSPPPGHPARDGSSPTSRSPRTTSTAASRCAPATAESPTVPC